MNMISPLKILSSKHRNDHKVNSPANNIEASPANAKKSSVISWLTLAVAICGVVISFYIAKAQMASQKDIANLQHQLGLENNYTKLSVSINGPSIVTLGNKCEIRLYNSGDVYAKDIKIFISLTSINDKWKSVVKDIHSFAYDKHQISLSLSKEYTNIEDDDRLLKTEGDNTIILNIDSLAPKDQAYIDFGLDPNIVISQYQETHPFVVKTTDDLSKESIDYWLYDRISGDISDKYEISKFLISVAASNLEKATSSEISISLPSFYNLHCVTDKTIKENDATTFLGSAFYSIIQPQGANYTKDDSSIDISTVSVHLTITTK